MKHDKGDTKADIKFNFKPISAKKNFGTETDGMFFDLKKMSRDAP
jgi:hypothetical protein